MAQRILPFEYESEENPTGMTGLAGLPVYLELMAVMGLPQMVREHLDVRPGQGWTDTQQIVSLVGVHLAGGNCMDDVEKLEPIKVFAESSKRWKVMGCGRDSAGR